MHVVRNDILISISHMLSVEICVPYTLPPSLHLLVHVLYLVFNIYIHDRRLNQTLYYLVHLVCLRFNGRGGTAAGIRDNIHNS